MANTEANNGNLATTNPVFIWDTEEKRIVQSYLTLSPETEQLQLEHEVMKPEHDAHVGNEDFGRRSEPIDSQREEISALAQGQGTDPETILTAHQDEPNSDHSSSSQPRSPKHNLPKFLAKNIKKLVEAYLQSTDNAQEQQELNHLYLDFVNENLKLSLKSINSFCFTSPQQKKNENEAQTVDVKFKLFLKKKPNRPEVAIVSKEQWRNSVQQCQEYFQRFIFSKQTELKQLAQGRGFTESSKNAGLADYTERFVANMKKGTPRGKDVKSKRSTQ